MENPLLNSDFYKDFKTSSILLLQDLIERMLVYEPEKRLSPYYAVRHPFFNKRSGEDAGHSSHSLFRQPDEVNMTSSGVRPSAPVCMLPQSQQNNLQQLASVITLFR